MTAPMLITDRKIRVAVIGCGRVANFHFDAIAKHPNDLELVAICDQVEPALKAACDKTGAEAFTNIHELLAREDLDVVTLCTPSGMHPRQAVEAMRAGKHVVTEKPMATHFNDASDMVKVADDEEVRLFVVKQNRYNTTIQALRNAVDKNRFGKIYLASANVFWHRPQSYYDRSAWRGTWEYDGGALMNQASHYVDILSWMLGPVDSVSSFSATQARRMQAEDSIVINFQWRSGALGSLNVTTLTHDKDYEGSLTLIGEKGRVRIGGIAMNQIEDWSFDEPQPEDETISQASYETASVYGEGHPYYYENVINTLRGNERALVDGREGLRSIELMHAAYVSARDRCVVSLPLDK